MPIVAHNDLPSFARLQAEGRHVMSAARARHQDFRPLHVGLLNMMPDAALEATERQFFRLVGSSNPIAQFYIHPFTLDSIPRSAAARDHIERYYEPFSTIRADGLDALIISGANPRHADLSREEFFEELVETVDWASEHVTSSLCSCLATHAILQARHGIRRQALPGKCWGVFDHRVTAPGHPLVAGTNTRLFVPHSRFNEITRAQLEAAGLHVLVESADVGVQLAVSPDGFRIVFLQGHPEYDTISLLKEFKREVARYVAGVIDRFPPLPTGYFDAHSVALLHEYEPRATRARELGAQAPPLPESLLLPRLENTWHDSGESLIGNWIGLVYQLTHAKRERAFMDDVDPADPLGWLAARAASR